MDIPILAASIDELKNPEKYVYFIAIGNNKNRKRWSAFVQKKDIAYFKIFEKEII